MTAPDLHPNDGRPLQFFPVDIGHYDHHPTLATGLEVQRVAALLKPFGAETDPWPTPQLERGSGAVNSRLDDWSTGRNGCDTVLYWVGHGASDGRSLALLAHAESPNPLIRNGISHLDLLQYLKTRQGRRQAGWAAVFIDACTSRRFVELMSSQATADADVGEFILVASAQDGSTTLGAFRDVLDRLLTVTFRTHDTIGLYTLAEQINCAMGDTVAYARTYGHAALRRVHPTVSGRAQAPLDVEAEIETALSCLGAEARRHFVDKAAGGELGEQTWYFEGRETERYDLMRWLSTAHEGLMVVTGPAGSGKSALLGHVLIHTRPELAEILRLSGHLSALPEGTPHPRHAFDAAIPLTGLTPQLLVDRIAQAAGIVQRPPDAQSLAPRMAWLTSYLGARRQRGTSPEPTLTLLVDALDEAHLPLVMAAEVLRPLAATPGVRLVVGTRRSTREGPGLPLSDDEDLLVGLGVTAPGAGHQAKVLVGHDREATTRYIRRRLHTARDRGTLRVDPAAIERTVHSLGRLDREFLFARLAVHEILHDPGLALTPTPLVGTDHRRLFAGAVQRLTSINPAYLLLLEALALAQGHGLPDQDDLWLTVARALVTDGTVPPLAGEDVVLLLRHAAPYVTADHEQGQTVYRLAHRAFAEHFVGPSAEHDDRHARIAAALARQANARLPEQQPNRYVEYHLADHAALGGPAAWDELAACPRLLDRLDPTAVAGSALRTGFGRLGLPPAVAGAVAGVTLLVKAAPEDRRGIRELATARCTDQGTPPPHGADPLPTWSLRWAQLLRHPVHLPLQGHRSEVLAVAAFTSWDGRPRLASGGADATVRIWDPLTAEQASEPLEGHGGAIHAIISFTTPDHGTRLATAGADGTIRIWNPATFEQTSEPLRGHTDPVHQLATAAEDDSPQHLVPVASGPLEGHNGAVHALASFTAPDRGIRLATAGADGTIRIWDPVAGREKGAPITGHSGAVQALTTFTTAEGRVLLASGGEDETVRVWDPATGRQTVTPLVGHSGNVQAVVAFPGSSGKPLLASAGDDLMLRIWDPETGRETAAAMTGHTDWIGALATFSGPDGRPLLASCSDDYTIRIWDPIAGRQAAPPLHGHDDWVGAVTAFTLRDGRALLATGSHDRAVRVWDPTTAQQAAPSLKGHTRDVGAVASFPGSDGRTLLVTGGHDRRAHIWESATGQWVATLGETHERVEAVTAFNGHDGRPRLALARGGTVRIWDPGAEVSTASLLGHTGAVRGVTTFIGTDGRTLLATCSEDRTIRIWDPSSAQQTAAPLLGHTGGILALTTFETQGGHRLLASCGYDGTVRVWDPVTARQVRSPLRGHQGAIHALAACMMPTATRLVTGGDDQTVRIWDPMAGRQDAPPLLGHTRPVHAVVPFTSPTGRALLATGGEDRSLRIWDRKDRSLTAVLPVDLEVYALTAVGSDLVLTTDEGVAVIGVHCS
ncbi:hypothetical protein ACIPSE_40730 [Streptomyces sp. NPDC090106]|uniref:hypothetical protein n=1 Tax=Streptomyces sp. NPDC090106 TaxID=3365946 RepID=UPI0038182CD9